MPVKTEAAPYIDAFRADPSEPSWLAEARRDALGAFGQRGFPSRREEAWRFTSLRPLTDAFFCPVLEKNVVPLRRTPESMGSVDTGFRQHGAEGIEGTYRLVFVNGALRSTPGDLPNGVWLGSLKDALAQNLDWAIAAIGPSDLAGGQPFASLNAALFADGFVLALDEGVTLDRAVEIVHIADSTEAASIHPRNVIALAKNSRATLIETYTGQGRYWVNAVSNVSIGDGASLAHVKLQNEGRDAIHFGLVRAALAASATYRNFSLTLGANLSRNEVQVLLGDGANVGVSGAYLQRGEQDATNVVVIDHAAPNATTHELFKGVLDERSHGAFLGTIRVREGAQKTDARQTSRALLLSGRASVDTKPELEILADDVKCAHGATVGDLDKAALFYLRARGIGLEEARHMLIEAFVLEAIETVERPELRNHLAGHVRRWLSGEGA